MASSVVVTLTSYPGRIAGVHLTIESLVNQSVRPDKIVLWLAETQFPGRENDLPEALRALESDLFSIEWCEDLRSYKKLIPAIENYPDSLLITVDDDFIFSSNLVAKLLDGYERHPDCVICSRVTKFHECNSVFFADTGGFSYWREPSALNKLAGGAGCLYPPGCLDREVLNLEACMRLAPTSDDLWFWLMAVKNGTKIYRIPKGEWLPKPNPINDDITPLSAVNDSDGGFFYIHFDNILHEYPEVEQILNSSSGRRASSGIVGKVRKMLVKTRRFPIARSVYSAYLNSLNRKKAKERYLLRRIEKLERTMRIINKMGKDDS